MENFKRHIFYIFLFVNTILWSFLAMLRNVPSFDSMEAINWGELISFGTNKHPPLSGWLMSSFYHICGDNNFVIYILGQLCILVGFIFVYKIAKFFVSEEKAICSAMILETCYYYTYYYYTDNFNCNIILMPLWPMVIYYFYKGVKDNKLLDWVLFGLTSGLAFLGKYQIVFLFAAMFVYLIVDKRETFKQKGMYIAVLTGFAIILPHVIWLFKTDFFSFGYLIERTHASASNVPAFLIKLGHVFFPIKFIVGQLIALAGCLVIYGITALQARNISYNGGEKSDKIFLFTIFFLPILFQGLMGLVTGERVPSIWGSIMVGMGGLMLFYFFPIEFKENTFKYFSKWIFATMIVFAGVTLCVAYLQTNNIMFMPIQKIEKDIMAVWNNETNNAPVKYIGGDGMIAFPLKHFNEQKPVVILDTFGYKNPWINHEDVIRSGAIIVIDKKHFKNDFVREYVPLLDSDISVNEYKYNLCNAIGKCEEKIFYYSIIRPGS